MRAPVLADSYEILFLCIHTTSEKRVRKSLKQLSHADSLQYIKLHPTPSRLLLKSKAAKQAVKHKRCSLYVKIHAGALACGKSWPVSYYPRDPVPTLCWSPSASTYPCESLECTSECLPQPRRKVPAFWRHKQQRGNPRSGEAHCFGMSHRFTSWQPHSLLFHCSGPLTATRGSKRVARYFVESYIS